MHFKSIFYSLVILFFVPLNAYSQYLDSLPNILFKSKLKNKQKEIFKKNYIKKKEKKYYKDYIYQYDHKNY